MLPVEVSAYKKLPWSVAILLTVSSLFSIKRRGNKVLTFVSSNLYINLIITIYRKSGKSYHKEKKPVKNASKAIIFVIFAKFNMMVKVSCSVKIFLGNSNSDFITFYYLWLISLTAVLTTTNKTYFTLIMLLVYFCVLITFILNFLMFHSPNCLLEDERVIIYLWSTVK